MAAHVRPGERVLWSARPSLVGLAPILASAVAGLGILVWQTEAGIESPGQLLTGAPALVLGVAGILFEAGRRFLVLRFTTYAITDERVYAVTSFFTVDVRSTPLARATHVSVRQGALGRALGIWSARVSTYGEEGRALHVPSIRDGAGFLREASAGLRRGANVEWLRRGD